MGKLRESRGGWLSPHPLTLKRGRLWCPDPVGLRAPLEQHTGCGRWGRRVGRPREVCGSAGRRSVVELALARLVDEAALVLGPARAALADAVLPLHHFGAQRVALRPLPSPLLPPSLARLLQQRSPRRQRGGGVAQGPGLPTGGRQLPAGTEQGLVMAGQVGGRRSALGLPTPSPIFPSAPCYLCLYQPFSKSTGGASSVRTPVAGKPNPRASLAPNPSSALAYSTTLYRRHPFGPPTSPLPSPDPPQAT